MMKNALTLVFIVLASGCTSHLYSGTTSYEYNGKTCYSLVYWNDSTHLFNQDGKATTVVIKTPSGRSYFLSTPEDGTDGSLELILPSGEFVATINNSMNEGVSDTDLFCGTFHGKKAHQEDKVKQTEFYLYCDQKPHPLRKPTDTMKASETAYVFEMNEPIESFSWFSTEEIKADISQVKCE
jgi:hypothetical protein